MAATNIDEVFAKIEKDFVELSKTAARSAATKAQKDIKEKADKFIDEYYAFKPKWYGKSRKKALYKLVQKYYQETQTKKGIVIEFGIQYTPSKIYGIHKSYSPYHQGGTKWISRANNPESFHFDKGDNGIPEATWITDKFLEGIHPSGKLGDDGGVKDPQSPDEKMQKFFDKELGDLVMTYMNKNLLDLVKLYF
jgi:hypothetical protein